MADVPVFARIHVLVLCDEIEKRLGEEDVFTLRGVRTQVRVHSFPYRPPQFCVYLQVTGHEGTASGHVLAVREATEEEMVSAPIDDIQLRGPLTVVHVGLRIRNCEFPVPGVFWFQMLLNQKLVAERRFHILETTESTNGQPTS
jgi:hypothetical protein